MTNNHSTFMLIRMIFLIVFLGWILVWIMLPTKTYYYKWSMNMTSKLNSTYFGNQGTNLLLFSFPMICIAALSCIYLHYFQRKTNNFFNSKRVISSLWSRPIFMKAPIGIVTLTELAFGVMFIVLLIWSLANYLYVSYEHLHMHGKGEKVWQAKFRSVALRLGYIGNTCWAFLFFPITRGSSILPLIGLTSESSIKYHIWLGHLQMFLFGAHTLGFIIYWAMTNQMAQMIEWNKTHVPNLAGIIAILLALAMWVTSIGRVRRKMFEVFYYTHHLYALYIFFYVLHVGASYFCMILPGIFLFIIDRHLRFLQSRYRVRLLSARILPCDTIEFNFSKTPGLNYNPTSLLFINVPIISKLQWHPFTVTSNSNMESDKLSIVIKSEGSWSQNLYKQLSSSSFDHLEVSVEGPYGPSTYDFLRYECLMMISGGGGITPLYSIIREIIFQSSTKGKNIKLPKIQLVCAFKKSAELTMLDLLLPAGYANTLSDISEIELQIEAYVTRETEQPANNINSYKPLQNIILFKPNPQDTPISSALGPNSWLWLAAIISSSFVLFLLFLSIVTRFYIYPIDHNTGEFYNFSFYAIWDMFLVCACIFLVSSVAFLWCKEQNAKEGKQIQIVELEKTPETSASSLFCVAADRELESLPNQSLLQSINVHYGARPDLKKILLDCKGTDIGVLVCGPSEMRHEVAEICSSGLADNLHFKSTSFKF